MVIRGASIFALVVLLAGMAAGQITFGTDGDYIQVSTNRLNYGTNYAVCAWVNPNKTLMNANPYGGMIINDRSGSTSTGNRNFVMGYSKTDGLFFYIFGGTNIAVVSYPTNSVIDGKWTHLTGVCDGDAGQLRIYVDGALANSANFSFAPDNNSVATRIGNWAWAPPVADYQWEGSIQDVRIYSRVLTASEAATLALYPWSLTDDPAMILRTAIDQFPTGTYLGPFNSENYGAQLITPMKYHGDVTSAVTRVQIAKPLQMELP